MGYDRSNAPKNCQVYGRHQGHDADIGVETGKMFLLAKFRYDLRRVMHRPSMCWT